MNTLVVSIVGRKPGDILEPVEAATILNTSLKTLEVWRAQKRGPKSTRMADGWRVGYLVEDVVNWIANDKPWSSVKRQRPRAA